MNTLTAIAPHSIPAPRTGTRTTRSRQISLPATSRTVAHARRFIADTMAAWDIAEPTRDDAVLIASELAANAATHARTATYDVTCRRDAHTLEIAVTDTGNTGGVHPHTATPTDEHGRGLAIVEALATTWGTRHRTARTDVWARLRC